MGLLTSKDDLNAKDETIKSSSAPTKQLTCDREQCSRPQYKRK